VSPITVAVREWEILPPTPGSPLADRRLASESERKLTEQLKNAVEILELVQGIELRATSFVGRFKIGEITVSILPKLQGARMLTLLRYAFGLRDLHLFEPVGYPIEQWTFQDLLVQQLISETSELLARGIHRDYERHYEELQTPRGRIDFKKLIDTATEARPVLPCNYYPRTEDTTLNRALLAGLAYAAGLVVDADMRTRIRQLTQRLSLWVSQKSLSATLIDEALETVDRRTSAYKPALSLIELLIRSQGVSLDGESDRISLRGFLFDMNRFFQALISRFLHDHLDNVEIQDEFRLKDVFCYDPYRNPRRRSEPVQRPDFVIRRNRTNLAILDAKYRDLWEKPLPRDILYQLALYALGSGVQPHKAVVLFPTLAFGAQDQVILVRDPTDGLARAEVILRPVNLLFFEELLRARDARAAQRKTAFARQLTFGSVE